MPGEKHWYVVYTASRAEKVIKEQLNEAEIEHFQPVQPVARQWLHRKKKVEVPLLTGYIFVRIPAERQNSILAMSGAIAFLKNRSDNSPAIVPDKQLFDFRSLIDFSEGEVEMTNDNMTTDEIFSSEKTTGEWALHGEKQKMYVRIDGLGCAIGTIPSPSAGTRHR